MKRPFVNSDPYLHSWIYIKELLVICMNMLLDIIWIQRQFLTQ